MLNQQETSRRKPVGTAFETRDFYLACFLRCMGYDLIDLRAEGRRKVFVFLDRPARREDVLAFYGARAVVSPLTFAATIKEMKALLHPMRDMPISSTPRAHGDQMAQALAHLEKLVVEGVKHGFFDCHIACETGNGGKRHLVIRAGKSHKFTIPADEVPR